MKGRKRYVVRSEGWEGYVPPTIAAVETDKDGFGRDIAWFYHEKDAQEYVRWKEGNKGKKT